MAEAVTAPQGPQENTIVPGTVVRLTETAAVVAFGWTSDGLVPLNEFELRDGKPVVKAGDTFEVLVETLGEDPAQTRLSREKAQKLRIWDEVIGRCAQGTVEGTVAARITGGYSVDVGMYAFLPAAQADTRRGGDPDELVGQTLSFKVTELDKRRGKIVVSRRALIEKEQKAKKKETLARISEGAELPGIVKTVTDYGAFVDVGGIDGLIHVSQMSWGHVRHPREVLEVGDEVKVKVLKWEADKEKLSLGLKQLLPDPWADAKTRFPPGTRISGKVAGLAEFGAFVELAPGIEGLIHVSQMSWTRSVTHPSQVLKAGEQVEAQVLEVDTAARRLSLGMRQLLPNPWDAVAEKYVAGTRIKGRVRSVTDFGVFVEVAEGIEGLVHVSELTWTGKVADPRELYKKGDEVEAVVLAVDVESERMSLSIKQLLPDPWQAFAKAHPPGTRLQGKVKSVVEFGAFVELAPGFEGLVHVSELREERVERAADVVKPDEMIEVQVLEVNPERRKISLSVKALNEVSEREMAEIVVQGSAKTTLGDLFADKLTKK